MKRFAGFAVLVALLAFPGAATAQETAGNASVSTAEAAEKLALSNRFIALLQTDQFSDMYSQMMTSMMSSRGGMTEERSAALGRALSRVSEEMFPRLFSVMAPIYADIFSLDELRTLVAFYESDVGQSMMRKSYAAAPRITEAMTALMPELMSDMVDIMCDETGCTDEERARRRAAVAPVPAP